MTDDFEEFLGITDSLIDEIILSIKLVIDIAELFSVIWDEYFILKPAMNCRGIESDDPGLPPFSNSPLTIVRNHIEHI